MLPLPYVIDVVDECVVSNTQFVDSIFQVLEYASGSMMCERLEEFLQACTTGMYKLCQEIDVMLSKSSLIIIEIFTMGLY